MAGVLLLAWSPATAAQYEVGSFSKITGAPGSQVVPHGMGVVPKAVLLWTDGRVNETLGPSVRFAFGASDGTSSASLANSMVDASAGTHAGSRYDSGSAIHLINAATGAIVARATLSSWSASSFTLNWTVNDATAYVIHYLVIGGPVSAKLIEWNRAAAVGNQAVTGVGFRPDLVISAEADVTAPGPGIAASTVLGVMDSGGRQWSNSVYSNTGVTTATQRAQSATSAFFWGYNGLIAHQATFVSMDANGFTINNTVNDGFTARIFSLALQGVQAQAGTFNKATGTPTATQPITGLGFTPRAVMLSSVQNTTSGLVNTEARFGLGASDGTRQASATFQSQDNRNPSNVDGVDKTSKVFVKVNNATPTINAEANLASLDASGFTLQWTTNDNVATQMLYLALGDVRTNYRSIGTVANYGTFLALGAGTMVTATPGSTVVSGSSTAWATQNRGTGDLITIPCPDPPTCTGGAHYTILSVDTNTSLTLTSAYSGAGTPQSYMIRRQFATPNAWETCVDGGSGTCAPLPNNTASLIADNRREVGVFYKDSVYVASGMNTPVLRIDGSVTDSTHTIRVTAIGINRHYGIPGAGVVFQADPTSNASDVIEVIDPYVTVEWIETLSALTGADNIELTATIEPGHVVVRNNLIHGGSEGIEVQNAGTSADIYNNIMYGLDGSGIQVELPGGAVNIFNNSVYLTAAGTLGIEALGSGPYPNVVVRNNLAVAAGNDFKMTGPSAASSNNMSNDATAFGTGSFTNVCLSGGGCINFTSGTDLHLLSTSNAIDKGATIAMVGADIDAALRLGTYDIGADEFAAAAAVDLVSFDARGEDGAVALEWETGSEIDNLGFHLYRAPAPHGPWERITAELIPGLGSSPVGARYGYRDAGLPNGATFWYRLEDVETTGRTKLHGPVSATPAAGAGGAADDAGSPEGGAGDSAPRIAYGNPEANALEIVRRTPTGLELELRTEGFYAIPQSDGSVRLEVPGFDVLDEPGRAAVPVKRSRLEVVAGRGVTLGRARADDVETFPGLRPADAVAAEIRVERDGTIRLGRRAGRRARRHASGLDPEDAARLLEVGFQGEVKKALVELAPLRWDAAAGQLLLAKRLRVALSFASAERDERSLGGARRRRARRQAPAACDVVARLATREPGLYRVGFEELFGGRKPLSTTELRLSRGGAAVPYHIEPDARRFGPGSSLYFLSEGASANPWGRQAVYELERGPAGAIQEVGSAAPRGSAEASIRRVGRWEETRYYAATLLDAPEPWFWSRVFGGQVWSTDFALPHATAGAGRLELRLQGGSDTAADPDHHVRVRINGVPVGEVSWDGEAARVLEADVPPGVLVAGANRLEVENAGDTGASSTLVYVDRFAVDYAASLEADAGVLAGRFEGAGRAEALGVGAGGRVLDTTDPAAPRWLQGAEATTLGLSFRAEAGHSYLAVDEAAVLRPDVVPAHPTGLRSTANGADYLLIGPRAFVAEAAPLLALRRQQGLAALGVAIEDVFDEFGHGEARPEALRDFLAYAYHEWQGASLRYAVLLGDASFDPQDLLGTGIANPVPAPSFRSRYMWTAADPEYAAVNGEDALPDIALGRLPASSPDEARALAEKIVAWESAGWDLDGPVALVADNSDAGGDFEGDAERVAATLLAGRELERIYVSQLGAAGARAAVRAAFDRGASLVSYMGHGALSMWASENIFSRTDVPLLLPQGRQPLVLTMDCLNGYFTPPATDALAEMLLGAPGRGAIAAFSPSGLSQHSAAQRYHEALVEELVSGRHARLGDAVLAAQIRYADSGALPELLALYHLFGDPALRLH